MNLVADKCNRCGKMVIKGSCGDSSDMVRTNDSFLYLCDVKPGESSRPSLRLREYGIETSHSYCLDCLVKVVTEWVEEMKKRGKSDIPLQNIVLPDKRVSSPCPVCGR